MSDIENGRVRLPPLQQEFVWSPSKVIDLVESIYKCIFWLWLYGCVFSESLGKILKEFG